MNRSKLNILCLWACAAALFGAGCSGGGIADGLPLGEDQIVFDNELMLLGPVESGMEGDNEAVVINTIDGIQFLRLDGTSVDFTQAPVVASGKLTGGQTKLILTPTQFFGSGHSPANFMGYYPAGTSDPSGGVVPYTITGQQDILVSNTARAIFGTNSTANPLQFRFQHKLALIEMNITAADQGSAEYVGKITHASIMASARMQLEIASDGSSVLDKIASDNPPVKMDFYKPATAISADEPVRGTVMVHPDEQITSFVLGFENLYPEGKTYVLTNPLTSMKAGHRYKINVTVRAYIIEFDVIEVADWSEDGDNTGINIGGSQ